ncbi:MAG: tetratricopeptide repeat protein, partial [Deltaproteobacteria bacterium]|nr:tetratricopeptide repeat protein [Deltaproteobacteria bacterium]
VADSLFKLGMCHKRMGRSHAARRFFERVRRQFPESVAARLSVQEDA